MPLPPDAVALDNNSQQNQLPADAVSLDDRGSNFNEQFTKQMYEHVPFGKRLVGMLPEHEKFEQEMKTIPEAEGVQGEAGKMAGQLVSFAPAFEAGGMLAAPSKLLGGSIGFGGQIAQEGLNKGEDLSQAGKEGAETAAATAVGGKALEGAGKFITAIPQGFRDVAGRIHNYIVKVPDRASSYGKDPLGVLQKEAIPANVIGDYAKNSTDRLEQRTKQLNGAIADSDATLNLEDKTHSIIDAASTKAEGSLQDQSAVKDKLSEMSKRITDKYGNLDNISLQKAVQLKRQLADDFPFSPMEAKNSTGNILAQAAHQIHHAINDEIDLKAPEVSELNDRVSSLIDISKAAKHRVSVESRSNPIGLIASIVGVGAGAGAIQGHPIEGGLSAALILKGLSSPAVLTRVANTLSALSNVDRMNLYKAVPAFKQLADKAMSTVSNKIQVSRGSVGKDIATKSVDSLKGTDLGEIGKTVAEPAVSSQPADTTRGIGGPEANMESEGAPPVEYSSPNPKGETTSMQSLREQYEQQRQPIKDDLNFGPDLSSEKGSASIGDKQYKVSKDKESGSTTYVGKDKNVHATMYDVPGEKNAGYLDWIESHDKGAGKELMQHLQTKYGKIYLNAASKSGAKLAEDSGFKQVAPADKPGVHSFNKFGQYEWTGKKVAGDKTMGMLGPTAAAGTATAAAMGADNADAMSKRKPIDDHTMLKVILGESENGGLEGQRAVASAIRNNGDAKAAHGAKTIVQKGENFYRRYSDGRPDRQIPSFAVKSAQKAVEESKKQDFAPGIKHWFSTSDLKQQGVRNIIKDMKLQFKKGDNYFYK